MEALQTILRDFEQQLDGTNYRARFLLEKVGEGTSLTAAVAQLQQQYQMDEGVMNYVEKVPYANLLKELKEGLMYRGNMAAGVKLKPTEEVMFAHKVVAFEQALQTHFPPATTNIYTFLLINPSSFWGFSYLLETAGVIYLFQGVSEYCSD